MPRPINNRAFTIIEMIFVIAIIGVIASFGLSLYEKQTETAKINKAVVEMQNIIRAASYYYSQYTDPNPGPFFQRHAWPDQYIPGTSQPQTNYSNSLNCDGKTKTAPQLCAYLSLPDNNKVLKNPWGNGYQWRAFYNATFTPPTNVFSLKTTVPTTAIATRIAAKLPNSSTTSSTATGHTVTVQIGPPGQIYNSFKIGQQVFAGAGVVPSTKTTCVPYHCPPGTVYEKTWTAIQFIRTGSAKSSANDFDLIKTLATCTQNSPNPPCVQPDDPPNCPPNSVRVFGRILITGRQLGPSDKPYYDHAQVMYINTCKRVA